MTDKKTKLFNDRNSKLSLKSTSKLPNGSIVEYDFIESFKIEGMPAPDHYGAIKNPDFIWVNLSQIKKLNFRKGILNPFVKTILFMI